MRTHLRLKALTLLVVATPVTIAHADPPPAAPAASTAAPAADGEAKPKKDKEDYVHFRFGLGLDGNYMLAPGVSGAGVGLQLRLGAQINQWTAVYYQGHGIVGGILGGGDSAGAGLVGAGFNSLMGELTLPVIHIGLGPSFDVIGIAGCGANTGCSPDTGTYFGIDGRVAIVIGGHGPGRHGGFAINFNAHPTFVAAGVLTTLSLGIGGEMY
jgi:hypothetical protein